jgi:hypothetical protein
MLKMTSFAEHNPELKMSSFVSPNAAKELIAWFGNTERFIRDHATLSQYYRDVDSAIEEELL